MKQETKICQNCKKEFTIEPEDFDFYAKIKVPPPTFCPECRMIRRMIFRNERSLYKRKCDATGKETISIYSSDKPFKVYNQKYWWSDNWDPIEYGKDYDFKKPFFEQFKELFKEIPLITVFNTNAVNSDYANHSEGNKDGYLIFGAYQTEKLAYATRSAFSRDSIDLYIVSKVELCYENVYCRNCYGLFFGTRCENCSSSIFLYDCRNCSNCFGCVGLRNKSYSIFNQSYSKEDYNRKIKEFDIGSFRSLQEIKNKFNHLLLEYPHRYSDLVRTINTTGDYAENTKNCHQCFDLINPNTTVENCKFLEWGGAGMKDSYDCIGVGAGAELHYEMIDAINGSRDMSGIVNYNCIQTNYTINCHSSSNLFGCIGLRNKKYCILNKQYTKEEYERLVPQIIEHMNKMPYISRKSEIRNPKLETNSNDPNSKFKTREIVYRYGEFFPPELSPFCYNETIAQEYFPLTKEQAIEQGYSWKEPEDRDIKIDIKAEDLPDHIKDVKDDIIGKVIECAHKGGCNEQCTTAFKIIEPELQFYRRMNLPLPRLCPNCRHYQRIKQRNPLKLWHRKCQCAGNQSENGVYKNTIKHFHGTEPCPNEFETTYAPERPEIVYCEQCYLREVV